MEVITSFWDNIKDKVSNPFFGTLIFVWLARNWELVYTILIFDDRHTINYKVNFIKLYFLKRNFWEEAFYNILITIVLIFFGLIFVIATRVLVNIANHNISPLLIEKTVSKLTVNKEIFDDIKSQRDNFSAKYLEANELANSLQLKKSDVEAEKLTIESANQIIRTELQGEKHKLATLEQRFDLQSTQIEGLETEINSFKTSLSNTEKTLIDTRTKFAQTISERNELELLLYNNIIEGLKDGTTLTTKLESLIPYEVTRAFSDLVRLKLDEYFFEIVEFIKDYRLNDEGTIKYFDVNHTNTMKKIGVLNFINNVGRENPSSANLRLTAIGNFMVIIKDLLYAGKNL